MAVSGSSASHNVSVKMFLPAQSPTWTAARRPDAMDTYRYHEQRSRAAVVPGGGPVHAPGVVSVATRRGLPTGGFGDGAFGVVEDGWELAGV